MTERKNRGDRVFKSTRDLVIAALLSAMSMAIPSLMGVAQAKIPEVFGTYVTATLLAHVPLMLAMMISPVTALAAYAGTTLAFFLTTTTITGLRAASHILFVAVGLLAYHKRIGVKGVWLYLLPVFIALFHATAETVVCFIHLWIVQGLEMAVSPFYLGNFAIGFGIFIAHSIIDNIIAISVYYALQRAKILPKLFAFKRDKAAEVVAGLEGAEGAAPTMTNDE